MKIKYSLLPFMLLVLAGYSTQAGDSWITKSDRLAEKFTKDFSELTPELGSYMGYQEFDTRGIHPSKALEDAELALLKKWKKLLEKKVQGTRDKNLKMDFLLLLEEVKLDLRSLKVFQSAGHISIPAVSRSVYQSLFQLVNDQSSSKRKRDAVSRFKYYMSSNSHGKKNIVRAYWSEIKRHQKKYKLQKKLYPHVDGIKKYLSNSKSYIKGVRELLEKTGRSDWKKEYRLFRSEVVLYDRFLKEEILPLTRKDPAYPLNIYKLILKRYGVDTDPEEMILAGQKEYRKLYEPFSRLAKKIAKKHNLKDDTPLGVIKFLKLEQVTSANDVSQLYHSAADRLKKIIKTHKLVSLPSKKLKIRLAGEAESKAAPIPHMNAPPFINNNGVLPEFVVPTAPSGKPPFDDFSYKSAAIILTAHEGRPGHDLQFSAMLNGDISMIRARYAGNSVNTEGWALYAERLVQPYLTDKEKLIALQMHLWRVARYFLDPMVQLGKAGKAKVLFVFNRELGVSKTMAGLEYQRYTFRSPGQATAYYHGFLKIFNLKKEFTQEYGKLKLKCFNDTLLSFGLLPHAKIRTFKEDFKKCTY